MRHSHIYHSSALLLVMLTLLMSVLPQAVLAIDMMDEQLSASELHEAQQIMRWSEMRYNNALTFKTIEEIYNENLLGGDFNTEGYVIATSECLSPCPKNAMCIALCVKGLVISSKSTERTPSHNGHDVKKPHEMILFIYPRGREKVPMLENFVVGQKYRFSISKNPYQAELLGYKIIK